MLGYSVAYFLPEYWSQTPLWGEKLIPLFDYLLNNSFVDGELDDKSIGLSSAFYELINKYQNPKDLPLANIIALVNESGYGYILDLLDPSADEVKILVYLLVLIHQLKGSRKGLEAVLSIFTLGTSPTDIQITQWWEALPVGTENTFNIDANINIEIISNTFFSSFSNFIRNYVYPELENFKVRCLLNSTVVFIPMSRMEITYTASVKDISVSTISFDQIKDFDFISSIDAVGSAISLPPSTITDFDSVADFDSISDVDSIPGPTVTVSDFDGVSDIDPVPDIDNIGS